MYDQEKGKKKSKRQTFVWIKMSSFRVPHLFLFPLWQGMLTFQENSTSLRAQPTQTIFFKVWFSLRLWFYHLEQMVGWKKKLQNLECTFPLLGHQLKSCLGYCGYSFPILCLSGDPDVKQNGKLYSHSLWVRSEGVWARWEELLLAHDMF